MSAQTRRPHIALFFMGGTISMTPASNGAIVPTLTGETLANGVPGLREIADLDIVPFMSVAGGSLLLKDILDLAAAIEAKAGQGTRQVDGIVVVQGTDTIEETAFALQLTLRLDVPLVVTGAMRSPSAAGADGPANLRSAVIVAATQAVSECGVTVVLNDELHSAGFVRKAHTMLPSSFASPDAGRMGVIVEGRVSLQMKPLQRLPHLRPSRTTIAPVALLTIALGDDGRIFPTLKELGYRGAVIEAMGAGHVPAPLAPILGELAQTMPVVLSSRVAAGPVLSKTYGYPGSETDLLARGLIRSGPLDGLKARIFLQLLLGCGKSQEEIKVAFDDL